MPRLPIGRRGVGRLAAIPVAGAAMLAGVAALVAAPAAAAPDPALAQALQAQTQALVDAVARGDKAVWDAAVDPAVVYVDENNKLLTKAQLLAGMAPLPDGLSGQIRVADFRLDRQGNVAVATYLNDESLDYQGQLVRTKYRVTDTWLQKGKDWKLIASATNAVLDDPPVATLPAATLQAYVGQYELTYDLHYRIDLIGGKLIGQRQGGKIVELKPEATDVLFIPGNPRSRKVIERDASGAVTGFADRREGHDIVWKKIQ